MHSNRGRAVKCKSLACKDVILSCLSRVLVLHRSDESKAPHLCCHKDHLQEKKAPGEASKARQLAESETSTDTSQLSQEVIEVSCVCTVQDMLVLAVTPLVELTCKLCF